MTAHARKITLKGLRTFADLCEMFLNMLLIICSNASRIDLVLNSFIGGSIKDAKRSRQTTVKPVENSIVDGGTPLPVNKDTSGHLSLTKPRFKFF